MSEIVVSKRGDLILRKNNVEAGARQLLELVKDTSAPHPEMIPRLRESLDLVHTTLSEYEAQHAEEKAPHLKAGREIDAVWMPTIKVLREAKARLAEVTAAGMAAVEETLEAVAATALQADADGNTEALVQASTAATDLAKVDTAGVKREWYAWAIDLARLPVEYRLSDDRKLAALCKGVPANLTPPDVEGVTWALRAKLSARRVKP